MLYLDTSLVVPLYVTESVSESVVTWFAERASETLTISDWVATEFVSALSIKTRHELLSHSDRARAENAFDQGRSNFVTLTFETVFFDQARKYISQSGTGLRASDALHLAIAMAHSAVLCTRDRRFAVSAAEIGAAVELV